MRGNHLGLSIFQAIGKVYLKLKGLQDAIALEPSLKEYVDTDPEEAQWI